jgi:hypothetical protein
MCCWGSFVDFVFLGFVLNSAERAAGRVAVVFPKWKVFNGGSDATPLCRHHHRLFWTAPGGGIPEVFLEPIDHGWIVAIRAE